MPTTLLGVVSAPVLSGALGSVAIPMRRHGAPAAQPAPAAHGQVTEAQLHEVQDLFHRRILCVEEALQLKLDKAMEVEGRHRHGLQTTLEKLELQLLRTSEESSQALDAAAEASEERIRKLDCVLTAQQASLAGNLDELKAKLGSSREAPRRPPRMPAGAELEARLEEVERELAGLKERTDFVTEAHNESEVVNFNHRVAVRGLITDCERLSRCLNEERGKVEEDLRADIGRAFHEAVQARVRVETTSMASEDLAARMEAELRQVKEQGVELPADLTQLRQAVRDSTEGLRRQRERLEDLENALLTERECRKRMEARLSPGLRLPNQDDPGSVRASPASSTSQELAKLRSQFASLYPLHTRSAMSGPSQDSPNWSIKAWIEKASGEEESLAPDASEIPAARRR